LSVVTLGNVGTYSGVIGTIFSGAQQALQVWARYVDTHGGLNCHPVKVVSADDGGDPSTSQSEVEQMVTQNHAIAFVGNIVPLTVQASQSYLEQQHIPSIGVYSATATDFQSPMLFPAGTEINHLGDGNLKLALAAHKSKLGFLYCVEAPACAAAYTYLIKGGHAQADAVAPVYSSSFSLTQPSFTAQCIQAQQAGADFVFMGGDGNSLERMARDCAAQNYRPLYEAVSLGISASMQADAQLDGMYGAQATFPWMDSDTPAQAAYQQAVKQYAPGLVGSGASSNEWTSGMLAVAASKYLGPNPTPNQFLQGLWSIKNNDLGGLSPPLTFNANASASVAACYFYIQLQGNRFVDPNHGKYVC
jgi:branched-chain amino acid transport system substrate-binding protein